MQLQNAIFIDTNAAATSDNVASNRHHPVFSRVDLLPRTSRINAIYRKFGHTSFVKAAGVVTWTKTFWIFLFIQGHPVANAASSYHGTETHVRVGNKGK
jgi:hypothetical protein